MIASDPEAVICATYGLRKAILVDHEPYRPIEVNQPRDKLLPTSSPPAQFKARAQGDSAARDLFMVACGGRRPLHVEIQAPDGPFAIVPPLPQPFAIIGQDSRAEICLRHEEVSRRHVYLQLIAGRVFWVDLKSRTGVRFQGVRRDCGWLNPDEALGIGPYQVYLARDQLPDCLADAPTDLWAHHLPPSEASAPVTITMVKSDKPQEATLWTMDRPLALVGRSSFCNLQMISTSVSRIHCALVRTALGVWAIDLLSQQGILINGVAVRAARLHEGDELRVGRFLLYVRYGLATRAQPTAAAGWYGQDAPWQEAGDNGTLSPNLPAAARPSNTYSHSDVVALVEQFGQMQHRMFDQFQQALMMMAQMLGSLHRDQMGLVRQEMNHVHELTQRTWAYQAELSKHAQNSTTTAPGIAAPLPPAPPTPPAAEPWSPGADKSAPSVPAQAASQSPATTAAPQDAAAPTGDAPDPTAPASPTPPADVPPPQSAQDVHVWLAQQIEAIQRERQTSWDRIASFFMRK